ncbi:MAG: TolC family protein, partial [Blastocatellia bacterium]|nr:TolC family protein [Blastocatellia bacterium]
NQNRRNLKALKEQLSIADMSFRKKLIELIARTQSAYYDLAFALENEKIQCDAVNLAAEQLRRAQTEVESGRVAPIEVDAVEAEFERRKEIAISELMSITQAENRLKNLILHDPSSDEWNYQILPTDKISFLPEEIDLEQAIETAMKKRPEIEEMNLQEKINRVEVDYMKNQAKPQIDVFYRFSTEGVAGGKDAPNFFNFKQQPDFIGGYATALRNIFGFRTYEIGASFNIPFRNRTAKANLTNALISSNQIDIQKKQLLQSILTEVRNAVQNLDVAAQRVEATASAVKAAEKQLIAEQVRFDVGLSTNYFVLEKQNNLSAARSRQLRAITDYIKARAELEKVIASNLP